MKDFINKNSKFIILILIIIILSFVGITFAVSSTASIGVNISAGDYAVVYTGSATLPSSKLQPIYDADLLSSANSSKIMKVTFTVKGAANNPTNKNIIYDVSLTNLNMPDELRSKHLKWRLYKNNSLLVEGNFSRQFDAQLNNRMVLTNTQQDLPSYSATADSYTFYVWISEACVGEITECTSDMSISPLVNKTLSGEIRIELSTGSKKEIVRVVGGAIATVDKLNLTNTIILNKSPNFGAESPEVLTYKEITGESGSSNINQSSSTYYVTYAERYEFDNKTGKYSLVNPIVAKYSDVYNQLQDKYIVSYKLSTSSTIAAYTNLSTIYYVVSATYDNGARLGVIEYNANTSESDQMDESETGIFTAEDDLGTSYYFRGNVTNNYVYFAGFYWRVIRINGDGTIRIIYDGTRAYKNGEASDDRGVAKIKYSDLVNDSSYIGYMYGKPNSSTYKDTHANINDSKMKEYLDSWYENNLLNTTYEQYIKDAIYCNDREVITTNSNYKGNGTGLTNTLFAPSDRIYWHRTPSLMCNQFNDRFSVNKNNFKIDTNGKLKYPIGLITVDEAVFAGGEYRTPNYGYYLNTGMTYYTMSPSGVGSTYSNIFYIESNGDIYSARPDWVAFVRPVISLRADAITGGSGTMTDPYTVG